MRVQVAAEAIDPDLVLLSAHGLQHGPACGERTSCPLCGEPDGPLYLPAERTVRRDGTFLYCNRCHQGWREIAA